MIGFRKWEIFGCFVLWEIGCGKMYTLRHTLFWGEILTHLVHLRYISMGVAKSILYATPCFCA